MVELLVQIRHPDLPRCWSSGTTGPCHAQDVRSIRTQRTFESCSSKGLSAYSPICFIMWSDTELSILRSKYSDTPNDILSDEIGRSESAIRSKANRIGLTKSNNYFKVKSIIESERIELDEIDDYKIGFIIGFLSGEGTFSVKSEDGRNLKRFTVRIELTRDDRDVLESIRETLGCGEICETSIRKNNEKGGVAWSVQSFGDIVMRIIPLLDEYEFLDANKKQQYKNWRMQIVNEVPKTKKFI